MTIHDEILRLRDVVRRVSDEPNIDTARALADDALARPMPQWQSLDNHDLDAIKRKWEEGGQGPLRLLWEDALRRKNGF